MHFSSYRIFFMLGEDNLFGILLGTVHIAQLQTLRSGVAQTKTILLWSTTRGEDCTTLRTFLHRSYCRTMKRNKNRYSVHGNDRGVGDDAPLHTPYDA